MATKKRGSSTRPASAAKRTKSPADIISPTAIPSGQAALGDFHGDLSVAERHAAGRDLRLKIPREAHGGWSRPTHHPGGVDIVLSGNKGRQQDLHIALALKRFLERDQLITKNPQREDVGLWGVCLPLSS